MNTGFVGERSRGLLQRCHSVVPGSVFSKVACRDSDTNPLHEALENDRWEATPEYADATCLLDGFQQQGNKGRWMIGVGYWTYPQTL